MGLSRRDWRILQSALSEAVIDLGGAENYSKVNAIGYGTYLIQIVFNIIIAVILWKKVGKTIDFEEIRKTW